MVRRRLPGGSQAVGKACARILSGKMNDLRTMSSYGTLASDRARALRADVGRRVGRCLPYSDDESLDTKIEAQFGRIFRVSYDAGLYGARQDLVAAVSVVGGFDADSFVHDGDACRNHSSDVCSFISRILVSSPVPSRRTRSVLERHRTRA